MRSTTFPSAVPAGTSRPYSTDIRANVGAVFRLLAAALLAQPGQHVKAAIPARPRAAAATKPRTLISLYRLANQADSVSPQLADELHRMGAGS